jgi:glycosyltransferase involved in cell wall biosynthesis
MRILYVIHRFVPCHLTGSEKVFATLSSAVARVPDYEVVVATGNIRTNRDFYHPAPKRFSETDAIGRVRVIRLRVAWALGAVCHLLNRFLPFMNEWTRGGFATRAFGPHIMGLERVIREECPDVIHTGPVPLYHVYATGKLALKHRIPLVITPMMHFDAPIFQNPRFYSLLARAAAVVAFTNYEKDRLVEKGVEPSRIAVIPATCLSEVELGPADGAAFRQQHGLTDEPLVLFLGSKDFEKGGFHLLDAWPAIRGKIPRARLVCAGIGTPRWHEALKSRNLAGIIDLDYIDGKDKQDLLAACDLLCVPSQVESFGIVLAEAWAKRKPVVGGSAGATREIVAEGKDGFTVDFGDVASLSRRVIELLSDPAEQARLGKNGRQKAELWTEENLVGKTVALYRKVARELV